MPMSQVQQTKFADQMNKEAQRIANVIRSGGVMRFHAEPSVPCQSLGEHVFGVVAIGMWIKTEPTVSFIEAMMLHDAAELYTGDIPFTAKRGCLADIRKDLEVAEKEVMVDSMFPIPKITAAEETVLKLADMLEGMRYVRNKEQSDHPVVADRWWHALDQLLRSEDVIKYLYHPEIVRAYELHRLFTPSIHTHRVARTVEAFYQMHQIVYEPHYPPGLPLVTPEEVESRHPNDF